MSHCGTAARPILDAAATARSASSDPQDDRSRGCYRILRRGSASAVLRNVPVTDRRPNSTASAAARCAASLMRRSVTHAVPVLSASYSDAARLDARSTRAEQKMSAPGVIQTDLLVRSHRSSPTELRARAAHTGHGRKVKRPS